MRVVAFVLALCPSALLAQDLRERSLEAEQRMLEQERRERQEQRSNISPPPEKRRDEKACENARVNYQVTCGHQVAPKYRSPSCREAEIFIRQSC